MHVRLPFLISHINLRIDRREATTLFISFEERIQNLYLESTDAAFGTASLPAKWWILKLRCGGDCLNTKSNHPALNVNYISHPGSAYPSPALVARLLRRAASPWAQTGTGSLQISDLLARLSLMSSAPKSVSRCICSLTHQWKNTCAYRQYV